MLCFCSPGEFVEMKYLTEVRTTLVYNMPLAEVVTDYFDQLKSRSKGYASMEYKVCCLGPAVFVTCLLQLLRCAKPPFMKWPCHTIIVPGGVAGW
jgi:translation elongation factor EF-4